MNDFDDGQFEDRLPDPFDDDLDEILVDDDITVTETNRTFPIAALSLLGIGAAALLCLGLYTFFFPNEGDNTEVADSGIAVTASVIAVTNEYIATQNGFVTQTLEARRLTQEAPTETATPRPSFTPTETSTPVPTNTQPAAAALGEAGDDDTDDAASNDQGGGSADTAEGTVGGTTDGTAGDNQSDGAAASAADTDGSAAGGGGDEPVFTSTVEGGSVAGLPSTEESRADLPETLPNTGFSVSTGIAIAIGLAFLFFISHRLRVGLKD